MGKQYGKWETVSSLDQGGQGWIYLVKEKDGNSERLFVLKRLRNPKRLDRFKAEIESLKDLQHPGIVKLVDFDVTDINPWFVQDYYEGGNLEEFIKGNNPISTEKIFDLFVDMSSALEYAHEKGFIHRDIKPANIFLPRDNSHAILGDFGLVWKDDDGERLTLTDEAVGSFRYGAPEVLDGRVDEPTQECDIYSLGKVLYYMLSGGRIFDREIHRDDKWDLVKIKNDINLEHANILLDNMITFDPKVRHSAKIVREKSVQAKYLINGEFAPLGGTMVARCKYCGIGHYRRAINSDSSFMDFFGFVPSTMYASNNKKEWRAMVCDNCGHIEFFRIDNAQSKWWPEQK